MFPSDAAGGGEGVEPLVSGPGGRKSWYQAWVEKVLTPIDVLAATHEAPGVLLELLGALEAAGLVCRMEAGRDNRAWALDPARFYVTARTAVMRCAGSNRTLVVPERGSGPVAGRARVWTSACRPSTSVTPWRPRLGSAACTARPSSGA